MGPEAHAEGQISSHGQRASRANLPAEVRQQMFREAAARLPVGHVAGPAEIAEHYLAFMRGRYVTGQSLIVDGGGVLV